MIPREFIPAILRSVEAHLRSCDKVLCEKCHRLIAIVEKEKEKK